MSLSDISQITANAGVVKRALKALELGQATDCTFLVGPDDESAKEIHGIKFDLLAASPEYFQEIFKRPIRIKNVEPEIFKKLIEFSHFSCLHTDVPDMDSALKLARAAVDFFMDDLGFFTCTILEKIIDIDVVWKIFDQHRTNRFVALVCNKFLRVRAISCLQHPTFLEISQEAFATFVAFEEMNLPAESMLVDACVRLANAKATEEEKRGVVRGAIGHLRLLAVAEKDLRDIFKWLTPEEQAYLLYNLKEDKPLLDCPFLRPDSMCSTIAPRYITRNLTLIADQREQVEQGVPRCCTLQAGILYNFACKAKKHLLVHGFDVLCKTLNGDDVLDFTTKSEYTRDMNVTVSVSLGQQTLETIVAETHSEFLYNYWSHFTQPVFVPKGAVFKVSICLTNNNYYYWTPGVAEEVFTFNDSVARQLFEDINFSNLSRQGDGPYVPIGGQTLCLVRNVHYSFVR